MTRWWRGFEGIAAMMMGVAMANGWPWWAGGAACLAYLVCRDRAGEGADA